MPTAEIAAVPQAMAFFCVNFCHLNAFYSTLSSISEIPSPGLLFSRSKSGQMLEFASNVKKLSSGVKDN